MFGVVLGSIICLILLMFVIVLAFMVVAEYMDGSWRWGVRDEKREKKQY